MARLVIAGNASYRLIRFLLSYSGSLQPRSHRAELSLNLMAAPITNTHQRSNRDRRLATRSENPCAQLFCGKGSHDWQIVRSFPGRAGCIPSGSGSYRVFPLFHLFLPLLPSSSFLLPFPSSSLSSLTTFSSSCLIHTTIRTIRIPVDTGHRGCVPRRSWPFLFLSQMVIDCG